MHTYDEDYPVDKDLKQHTHYQQELVNDHLIKSWFYLRIWENKNKVPKSLSQS